MKIFTIFSPLKCFRGFKQLLCALSLIFIVAGCTKTDSVHSAEDKHQKLIEQIIADPDFKPVAYMLNKDYIQLRMSVHINDSNIVHEKAHNH